MTLAEAREHLGLLGLFSLVVLLVQRLHPDGQVPVLAAAWYEKAEATFSDCLFSVRKHLWRSIESTESGRRDDSVDFPAHTCEHLRSCLAGAA